MVQKLYDNSPIWLQNIMVALAGYKKNRGRYGKEYYRYRDFLGEFDSWPLKKKLEYQFDELKKLLAHAKANSPFYAGLYKDIDLSSINTIDDLRSLPIVTKEMLRQNIFDVDTTQRKGLQGHTGGTTGKSLTVYYTKKNAMQRMALLDHFKARTGFMHLKMRRASFNGKHIVPPGQKSKIFWRYNPACKQMIFSSFHITEENCRFYVEALNRFKPMAIDGFFMSIYDIANYIERHSVKLDFQLLAVFPTSETLTAPGRELIERVFNCKVYDQYASSEGAPFITECPKQTAHVEMASGIFEHESEMNDEVLVTSFSTYGTPLIRYQIGDKVMFKNEVLSCDCNLQSIEVAEIQGRKMDFLYSSDGSKINSVNIANMFKNLPNVVIKAQLVQDSLLDIRMNLVVDKEIFTENHRRILLEEFTHKFGRDSVLTIEIVDDIARESSGKFKFVVNNVSIPT